MIVGQGEITQCLLWGTFRSKQPFARRRQWQPTPVFLPGESQGRGSLVGCCPWGRTESDTTEVTQQLSSSLLLYDNNSVYVLIQQCLTLCDSMDCSPPGSSVPGSLQVRILEWVAMPFSKGSSQPRNQTYLSYVSGIGRSCLYHQCHPKSPKSCLHIVKYKILGMTVSQLKN